MSGPRSRCTQRRVFLSIPRPTIALVAAGVEVDVLGIAYHDFTHRQREHARAIIRARRTSRKKSSITSRKASSRSRLLSSAT
jgi:hypothetical protein